MGYELYRPTTFVVPDERIWTSTELGPIGYETSIFPDKETILFYLLFFLSKFKMADGDAFQPVKPKRLPCKHALIDGDLMCSNSSTAHIVGTYNLANCFLYSHASLLYKL